MTTMRRRLGPKPNPTAHRRWVCRALGVAILALGFIDPSASAGVGWCRTDPVVVVDGRVADIFVSARFDDLSKINGPTEIVVSTPVGIDAELVIATAGFGYGEKVRFVQSESLQVTSQGIEVRVKVRVPARVDAVPVRVELAARVVGVLQPDEAEGNANNWIPLRSPL